MSENGLYIPEQDARYANPVIDLEEWRDKPCRHYFVHGEFQGTEQDGTPVRFCAWFPEKDKYQGRFFQYNSPAPEDEHESIKTSGEDDKILFALQNGAYYIASNQGGFSVPLGERCYQANAQTAVFCRKLAQRIYGYAHRPYGYVYGGSGGSFKTFGCIEKTDGIWDGAVPYVVANPMATPNVFCPRVRVMRTLGEQKLATLVDRMDAGGSGDIYEGLTDMERDVVKEATEMGFPKRGWFSYPYMGDGALSVLMPTVYAMGKDYFTDFWTKPGYEGTNPASGEVRDRVQFVTTVKKLVDREPPHVDESNFSTVDNSWIGCMIGNQKTPHLLLSEEPPADAYLFHCRLRVLSGKAKGIEVPVESIHDGLLEVGAAFDGTNAGNSLEGIAEGDEIMIDNSDYLAMQTFQRHQVPDETYTVYDIYRNADGSPKYPQFPVTIGPIIAFSGAGTVPCGDIHCKTIILSNLLDESAFAWHADWYRKAVIRQKGSEDDLRVYLNDNCVHDDRSTLDDPQHQISYIGILHQAILDVVQWVENGIEPPRSSTYKLVGGQMEVPDTAEERGGIQPVVHALANGGKKTTVKVGEAITFTAQIDAPVGEIVSAAWDYEKTNDFTHVETLIISPDGRHAELTTTHVFTKPGTWFPTLKAAASRNGGEPLTLCRNLDRVRVIVEE